MHNLKVSPWSIPIHVLDFYESLGFITKFRATILSVINELRDVLKPHNGTLMCMIESVVYDKAKLEFRKTRQFLEGSLLEYKGSAYIEDETIVGNADKVAFYMKDLVSHLEKS
jgi:hypothetical protein